MDFFRNFPFFTIILAMVSGPVSSVLSAKKARVLSLCVVLSCTVLSALTLVYTLGLDAPFV